MAKQQFPKFSREEMLEKVATMKPVHTLHDNLPVPEVEVLDNNDFPQGKKTVSTQSLSPSMEDPRNNKKMENYQDVFLQKRTISRRQSLPISSETFDKLRVIHLRDLKNSIPLSVWIDNVLLKHLEDNKTVLACIKNLTDQSFNNITA